MGGRGQRASALGTVVLLLLLLPPNLHPRAAPQPNAEPIELQVDASEAPRKIFHVRMTIPASPGPLTLVYPKWIPGEHGPTGPIVNLAGLIFRTNTREIPWRRDSRDMFAFHTEIPSEASRLDVVFDYLAPTAPGGFSTNPSAKLAVIDWHLFLLYPKGASPDRTFVRPRLRLPTGWHWGGALRAHATHQNEIVFEPLPLSLLIDTPIVIGAHYRRIELAGSADGLPPHVMDIVADSEWALEIPESRLAAYRRLVREARELFGAMHYRRYHFLVSLSDHISPFGLEHHQTSNNQVPERFFVDDAVHQRFATLLPHEFVHSWCGKTRRPQGLVTTDYQQEMLTDLLWVYEGLTEYYGLVLAVRSGLLSMEEGRQALAADADSMNHRTGRAWRSLQDTATAAHILYAAPTEWANWRRGVDFYPEGALLWLEADVLIRRLTEGRRSLDDFAREFFGSGIGPGGEVFVKPYTVEDVYTALHKIAPYDWKGFFTTRLLEKQPRAPLGGLLEGGWRVTYTETPNPFALPFAENVLALPAALGLSVKEDGLILDIGYDTPAYRSGLGPGMKIIAVNGRRFSRDVFWRALASARDGRPIHLLVENNEFFTTHELRYTGELGFPHLVRDHEKPDWLSRIFAPRATERR